MKNLIYVSERSVFWRGKWDAVHCFQDQIKSLQSSAVYSEVLTTPGIQDTNILARHFFFEQIYNFYVVWTLNTWFSS